MSPRLRHRLDVGWRGMNGMNDLDVGSKQALLLHRSEVAPAATLLAHAAVAMHGDRQAGFARSVPFTPVYVGPGAERTAQRDADGDAIIGRLWCPLLTEPFEIVEVHEPVGRKIVRTAVRESGAHAHVELGDDVSVRILWRAEIVVPVMDRSDAAIERLRQSKARRTIKVDRPVIRRKSALHGKIIPTWTVTDQAAHETVPQMPMRVDKSRQEHHAPAGDHLRIGSRQVLADGDDLAIAHKDIGPGHIAKHRVDRK